MMSGDAAALYPTRALRSRPREAARRVAVEPWLCGCREWQVDAVSDSMSAEALALLVHEAVDAHLQSECPAYTIELPEQVSER